MAGRNERQARHRLFIPGPCEVDELLAYLAGTHAILVSGGIGSLSGKIFRVGHMGKANTQLYLIEFLFAVETFLRQKGLTVPVGASLASIDSLAVAAG